MSVPAVKICGLTRPEDAAAAAAAGAAYLGVIFAAESPRRVDAAGAARVLAGLEARRVGVFVNASAVEMAAAAAAAGLDVLQLHGEEPVERLAELRAAGPWALWKAVRVRGADDLRAAVDRFAGRVDGLLLDTWSRGARGGTGVTFSWEEVAAARGEVPDGLFLLVAGGLRPGNVARAASVLRPDALDVSSGVECSPGIKDPAAIAAVINELQGTSR